MPPAEIHTTPMQEAITQDDVGAPPSGLRNQEIEEASNRLIIHRISMALIPFFIRTKITPNMVSCFGALSGLAGSFCYYNFGSTTACILGFVFMLGWHVFDGADGQLARQTGQCSPLGFVIDGICDYATYIFVYVALALALSESMGDQVWFLIVGAGACHAIQAAAFEMQREHYIQWTTHGAPKETPVYDLKSKGAAASVGSLVEQGYRFIQELFRPLTFIMEQDIARLIDEGINPTDVAASYRAHFRKVVLRWSILSANNRTFAIFVFCLAGSPLGYFIYEAVLLTLVLLVLLRVNKRTRSNFIDSLPHQDAQTL